MSAFAYKPFCGPLEEGSMCRFLEEFLFFPVEGKHKATLRPGDLVVILDFTEKEGWVRCLLYVPRLSMSTHIVFQDFPNPDCQCGEA